MASSLFDASRSATMQEKMVAYLDVINADQAVDEALLGVPKAAANYAGRVSAVPGEPAFLAAYGAALAANMAYTEKVAEQIAHNAPPSSTLAQKVQLPILRAAIELRHGRGDRAIQLLEPAKPYRLRDLDFPYLLGAAYLQAHRWPEAGAAYQEILDNPGVDGKSPMLALAHLRLAQVDALEGKIADSRGQYEQLFALWRDADPDLPVLKQAHAEYADLK
jgi:tetratricopeptide (TPR) repeat protein